MSVVRGLALVLTLALLTVGCRTEDQRSGTTTTVGPSTTLVETAEPSTAAPAPPVPALTWEPCGGPLECATLVAPLDYADPTGPTVDVAMARLPARDPDERIGTLFTNPGGPGASGIELLAGGGLAGDGAVRDRFDVVTWDPRGVGDSVPLECGTDDPGFLRHDLSPDDATETTELEQAARAVADECGAGDAALLPHLGTETAVRDLDLMRAALGEDRLDYVGYSYGTLLGALYADRYPERVRAMVLDGVVDPTADLEATARGQALGIEAALTRLLASCADPCELGDAAATYDDLARRLEAGEQGDEGPAILTLATWRASYDQASWPRFLDALVEADGGDLDGLRSLARSYEALVPYSPYVAVLCLDLAHPDDPADFGALADRLSREAPRLGATLGFELLPCAFWPAPATRAPGPVEAAGSAPILVIGNRGDAATPLANAEALAEQLDAGHLLVLDGEGHLSVGDPCIDDWVERYLVALELPPEGTVC